jgi:G3E family GTPase
MQHFAQSIPATIIAGYLGAGKTTLVNHLLRNNDGRRFAVLVNEFGELAVDADLIESDEGDLLSLSGGCICCSYGSDLMDALIKLSDRAATLDGLLIEASGVALPGGIVSALSLLPDYRADAVVVLADAETVVDKGEDRYLADTIRRQLDEADVVAVNKCDLVGAEALAQVLTWLEAAAPEAKTITVERAEVPLGVLLGARPDAVLADGGQGHLHTEVQGFTTIKMIPDGAVDANALASALVAPALGVVRAKGFVLDAEGMMRTVQVVGRRFEVTPAPAGVQPGLVAIGPSEQLNSDGLQALVTGSTRN